MKIRYIPLTLALLALAFIMGLNQGATNQYQLQTAHLQQLQPHHTTTIAVVNSDSGIHINGNLYNYSAAIIDTLGYQFTQVSPAMAQAGFAAGTFAGVVTFPSNHSVQDIPAHGNINQGSSRIIGHADVTLFNALTNHVNRHNATFQGGGNQRPLLPNPDSLNYVWGDSTKTWLVPFFGDYRQNPRLLDTRERTEILLTAFTDGIGLQGVSTLNKIVCEGVSPQSTSGQGIGEHWGGKLP